jgi:hypothetical protein
VNSPWRTGRRGDSAPAFSRRLTPALWTLNRAPAFLLAKAGTEREGFDLARFANLFRMLTLSSNLRSDNDFARLGDILFLHVFLPSRDAF